MTLLVQVFFLLLQLVCEVVMNMFSTGSARSVQGLLYGLVRFHTITRVCGVFRTHIYAALMMYFARMARTNLRAGESLSGVVPLSV